MSKQSASRPAIKSSKTKTFISHRSKLIVYGYARLTFLKGRLKRYIMPLDIVNIIFSFVTFRDYITIAMVGHVDSGKSTIAGQILHKTGSITDDKFKKVQAKADELGKSSFVYPFCLDVTRDERARGVTINGSSRHQFTIGGYKYGLLDIPGHKLYVYNLYLFLYRKIL